MTNKTCDKRKIALSYKQKEKDMKTIVQTKAEIEKEFKSHNEDMDRQIREQDALVKEMTRKALQKIWGEAKRNVDNNKVQ